MSESSFHVHNYKYGDGAKCRVTIEKFRKWKAVWVEVIIMRWNKTLRWLFIDSNVRIYYIFGLMNQFDDFSVARNSYIT
jgi:hypothetical protein